jgi:hypothetical protein
MDDKGVLLVVLTCITHLFGAFTSPTHRLRGSLQRKPPFGVVFALWLIEHGEKLR